MKRARSWFCLLLVLPALLGADCRSTTIAPLGVGVGVGWVLGFFTRNLIPITYEADRECFLNGVPIDCSEVPPE